MPDVNTFLRSEQFDTWLAKLKDKAGKARIIHRIRSAEQGNFGDCEPVGDGVSETAFTLAQDTGFILLGTER